MAKLTNEQLAEIGERALSATVGPWDVFPVVDNVEYVVLGDNKGEAVSSEVYEKDDAEFIANARTDIPALLDMIAELQAEVERKEIMHFKLIEELKKADLYSEKLERKYLSATLETVMDELSKKLRRR